MTAMMMRIVTATTTACREGGVFGGRCAFRKLVLSCRVVCVTVKQETTIDEVYRRIFGTANCERQSVVQAWL